MYYLVYISTAVKLLDDEDLRAILISSRRKNTARNISGLLLYTEGVFIQLLEGDKMEVELAYKAIELDRRHKNLILLVNGEHDKRMFPNWSMGYSVANKDLIDQMTGYVDPKKTGLLTEGQEHPALIVLRTFAENNNISV
ncbi:MAG: BLUF domain-containing protein [Bacteroidota bacterium]